MIFITIGFSVWVGLFSAIYIAGVCLQNRQRGIDERRDERNRALAQGKPDPITQRFMYNPVGWIAGRTSPAGAMVTGVAIIGGGLAAFVLVSMMLQ